MLRIAGVRILAGSVTRGGAPDLWRHGATGLALALAAAGAGCSTDFRRLEQPTMGLNEAGGRNEVGPRPVESIRRGVGAPVGSDQTWSDSGPRAPLPPVTRSPSLQAPSSVPPASALPNTAGLSKPFDRPKTIVAATPVGGSKIATAGSVDVQPGDSLFAIAKRHNVSIAALMDVNQLKSPNLKPGQKLALPATPGARKPAVRTETKVASAGAALPAIAPVVTQAPTAAPASIAVAPPALPSALSGEWTGSYTVKSGDSLYNVARANKVQLAELQRVNGIADPTKVRPGTVLKIPGVAGASGSDASRVVVAAAVTSGVGTTMSPKIINAPPAIGAPALPASSDPTVAPVTPTATPNVAPVAEKPPLVTVAAPSAGAAAANAKFRWPVQGQVLSGFGKRADGTQNDGIDIAVPAGTDVHAASAGTVAYAGSELKGYGHLILLRHDNGWVSAYAHASEILVKRGDAITRGQVIAKSGQSGTVTQPQLHFELRQGSKPVDPTPHLQR